MARARLAKGSSKIGKQSAGRRALGDVPVTIRSDVVLGSGFEQRIRVQLASRLGHAAGWIERATVRFIDVNGPRGGVDTLCRIKVVMSKQPSIVVEKRAHVHEVAFAHAVAAVGTAVDRTRAKHGLRAAPRRGPSPPSRLRTSPRDEGELIGRRVGRGPAALARALERPEKTDRGAYVDTAAPGASASDRRAGGSFTARRNTLARTTRATATLEDSRTRPSRKSTRRSANRGKPSQMKERSAAMKLQTSSARASRHR